MQGGRLARFNELLPIASDLFSVWTRAQAAGCRMCAAQLPPELLQWAHHFTRGLRHLMFHPLNWSVLCSPCHRRHTPADSNPHWLDWLRDERLGPEDFERLEFLRRARGRFRLGDVHAVILEAQQGIALLPVGPRREWAEEKAAAILERMVRLGVRAA